MLTVPLPRDHVVLLGLGACLGCRLWGEINAPIRSPYAIRMKSFHLGYTPNLTPLNPKPPKTNMKLTALLGEYRQQP